MRGLTMAGRGAGKVAFITGAARGQGRSHAIRLAEEGADIIAVDVCHDYPTVGYALGTEADLAETAKAVEALDRRVVATQADVRDAAALKAAVDNGVAQLGRLDIVCANAGICTVQSWDEVTAAVWQDTLDTNLTGVWNTMVAAAPHLIAAGGGSIICTSSTAGLKGLPVGNRKEDGNGARPVQDPGQHGAPPGVGHPDGGRSRRARAAARKRC